MMKLAIVGGRDYKDYNKFKGIVDNFIEEYGTPIEIISGGASGVDTMAALYARENGIILTEFKPDWAKYGKKAGILRNTDIINESTHVLALPTEKSVGTYDSINKAKKFDKILKVIHV